MRIVIPYTEKINPVVQRVLKSYGRNPEYIYTGDGDNAYWGLLSELWCQREPVIVIEHDVLPWPGALEELEACPCAWCSLTYQLRGFSGQIGVGIFHCFGCVKFHTKLMDDIPDAWSQMQDTYWKHLDAQFSQIAMWHGVTPHPHRPPAIHLHDYEADPVRGPVGPGRPEAQVKRPNDVTAGPTNGAFSDVRGLCQR
jgi:hypothetical protein